MKKNKERLNDIGRIALAPPGTELRKRQDEHLSKIFPHSDKSRKAINEIIQKGKATMIIQSENGANLPIDEIIRYFTIEYNDRLMKHGLWAMPSSFNVLEAFHKFRMDLNIFQINKENDHKFVFSEFLEFITSEDLSEESDVCLSFFNDGEIYSYNNIESIDSFHYMINNDKEIVVAGFSIVKVGSELNILLLCGEKTDLDNETIKLKEMKPLTKMTDPWKKGISPYPELIQEAVPLLGNKEYWQFVVLTRIDLEDHTQNARYLLKDCGNHFQILTDDLTALSELDGSVKEETHNSLKEISVLLDEYSGLFELCHSSMYLPVYFDHYIQDISNEQNITIFRDNFKKSLYQKMAKQVSNEERIFSRNISILKRTLNITADKVHFQSPEFLIEETGFWRKLEPSEIGKDKKGNEILGKNWIHKELSWERPKKASNHRIITLEKNHPEQNNETTKSGFVYIMRNASHPLDVFKIGITKRDPNSRASDLSNTTGSLDHFLVAMEWRVADCVLVENLIHKRLSEFRMKSNREFFKVPFNVIVRELNQIIASFE